MASDESGAGAGAGEAAAIEKLVHLAKLAESVERYDDMAQYMRQIVNMADHTGSLNIEQRNLFSVAFKNVVASKRSGWRLSSTFECKHKETGEEVLREADTEYKLKMQTELKQDCEEVLELIKNKLSRDDDSDETKIFYLKMRGDYIRYMVEVSDPHAKQDLQEQAEQLYEQAWTIAAGCLAACNPVRLGLALNYSVFHYEIRDNPQKATHIAQQAYDQAFPELENLRDPEFKDSALIMQLLRDNLSLWTEQAASEAEPEPEMGVQTLDD